MQQLLLYKQMPAWVGELLMAVNAKTYYLVYSTENSNVPYGGLDYVQRLRMV